MPNPDDRPFRLRLRSVRFKDGRAPLRMFYCGRPDIRREIINAAKRVFDCHPNPAAMALVVWDADCNSTAKMVVSDMSSIPTILVPDFVRNRLLAERIETWTLETLRDQEKR